MRERFKKQAVVLLLSAVYILASSFLIGFKSDQVVLALLVNILYFSSGYTSRLITGFSIFVLYWVIFDWMKALPNYTISNVAIESLYNLEKQLFGIHTSASVLTPNEYFALHHTAFLDVLCGLFYLSWVPVPLAFAFYLFTTRKDEFLNFSFTFLLVNLIGFVIYYIIPAAPPWYVQQYGFDFISNTPGNAAGLARFDQITGSYTFKSLYSKSSNVFAALPSLHSSYPVIVLYYGLKNRLGRINIFFAAVMLGIWFAAVYTSHHYLVDVLSGILTAIVGIVFYNKILVRSKWFNRIIFWYHSRITAD